MLPRLRRPSAVLVIILLVSTLPLAVTEPAPGGEGAPTGERTAGGPPSPRAAGTVAPLASPTDEPLYAVGWDPSTGDALLGGGNGTVLEYNATAGFSSRQLDPGIVIRHIAFRPLTTSTFALLGGDEFTAIPETASVLMVFNGTGFTRLATASYSSIAGIAWSADASFALVAARKGLDGVVLRYQGGSLTEVRTDPARNYKAACWGDQGAYLASYNYDNSSLDLQHFDGQSAVTDVPVQAQDLFATGLSWSPALGAGLCTAEMTTLLRFNAAGAVKVAAPSLKGELQAVAWSPSRALALVAGVDLSASQGADGVLFSYDDSVVTEVSTGRYWGLNAVAWHPAGRHALAAGDNGTVLRYTAPNTAPLCAMDNPGGGAIVGGIARVSGTASDPDGDPIVSVQVRVDAGAWQDARGGEAWYFDWDTTAAGNGQHHVYARSSDGVDVSLPDARQVIVDNPNHPPEVKIDSPAEGAAVSGTVTVSGTASDPDAGDLVTAVEVSIDGGPWTGATGTASWSFPWDTRTTDDGRHAIRARCSDGEAYSAVASRGVSVQNHGPNAPPTCAIVSPAGGSTVTGTVGIEGTASDADNGVLAVFVRIDAGSWQEASGNTSWSYSWNTAKVAGGTHLVSARAYDGIVNSSEARITLEVNHPPSCIMTAPAEGAEVNGVVTVQGAASDSDPGQEVVSVSVKVDSGDWMTATGTADWTYSWDTSTAAAGSHNLRARSYDGSLYSPEVSRTVTVEKPPTPVALSEPTGVGIDWVLLAWSRNLDADFARYEVFASEREGASLSELSPRNVPLQSVTVHNYTGLSPRTTYWFRVRVVDQRGLTAVSNEVYATTDRENTPPVAVLTVSRTRAFAGDTLTFRADGSYDPDRGGRIVRYQWDFEGRGRFDVDSGPISTQRHEFRSAGRYLVQVRVTDERGAASVTSVNVTITQRAGGGIDWGPVGGVLAVLVLVAAAAGYLHLRRRPVEVETYYEEAVRRPAARRRHQYWPDDEAAPGKKPGR